MHNQNQSQTNSKTNVPGCSNPDLSETSTADAAKGAKQMKVLSKAKAIEMAITRFVKGGGNPDTGRALLASDMRSFTPKNLPCALVYNGFATVYSAERMAAALTSN